MPTQEIIDLRFTTVQEPVPDFIYDELKEYIKDSNSYHAQPLFLREALGREHGVSADWVYLANGVDEIIRLAIQAFGSSAHIFTPTEYTTFKQFSPAVRAHYSLVDDKYKVSSAAISDASLIWLANPNNPIGHTEPSVIQELAANNQKAIIVVDEIYSEYAPQLSVISAVATTPNLIVCRGFSKTYGMAGIRLGYVIANPDLLAALRRHNPWANVAYPSCGMAAIALKHKDYYQQLRDGIIERKSELISWLAAQELEVIPSFINTIVIKLKDAGQATAIVKELKKRNIIVNSGANQDDKVDLPENCISFVVSTNSVIKRLESALGEILFTR